jgi:WD40 repeat protein
MSSISYFEPKVVKTKESKPITALSLVVISLGWAWIAMPSAFAGSGKEIKAPSMFARDINDAARLASRAELNSQAKLSGKYSSEVRSAANRLTLELSPEDGRTVRSVIKKNYELLNLEFNLLDPSLKLKMQAHGDGFTVEMRDGRNLVQFGILFDKKSLNVTWIERKKVLARAVSALTQDRQFFAVVEAGAQTIKIIDVVHGSIFLTIPVKASGVSALKFSPAGDFILVGYFDSTVQIFGANGKVMSEYQMSPGSGEIRGFATSPNSQLIVVSPSNVSPVIVKVATGHQVGQTLGTSIRAKAVKFSDDSRIITVYGDVGEVQRFESPSGLPLN